MPCTGFGPNAKVARTAETPSTQHRLRSPRALAQDPPASHHQRAHRVLRSTCDGLSRQRGRARSAGGHRRHRSRATWGSRQQRPRCSASKSIAGRRPERPRTAPPLMFASDPRLPQEHSTPGPVSIALQAGAFMAPQSDPPRLWTTLVIGSISACIWTNDSSVQKGRLRPLVYGRQTRR